MKSRKDCYLGNCQHTSSGGPRFPVSLQSYCFGSLLIAAASLDGLSHRCKSLCTIISNETAAICTDETKPHQKSSAVDLTPQTLAKHPKLLQGKSLIWTIKPWACFSSVHSAVDPRYDKNAPARSRGSWEFILGCDSNHPLMHTNVSLLQHEWTCFCQNIHGEWFVDLHFLWCIPWLEYIWLYKAHCSHRYHFHHHHYNQIMIIIIIACAVFVTFVGINRNRIRTPHGRLGRGLTLV